MNTKSIFGRLACETDASQIAEAALVLPLAFLMLLGVFWFGQAFRIYGTINHAAREGARAATAPTCATCSATNDPSQNAYNAIQSALVAAKLDPARLHQPGTHPAVCACGSTGASCAPTAVACDTGQANICVQGVNHAGANIVQNDIRLSNTNNGGGAGVCGVSVSFQYPYTFWLPFTSLNKQTIQLQAQSQMRAENQ